MSTLVAAYLPLFNLILIATGYAFSQYVVLRAGTFSVATAGFAALGAYTAAILVHKHGSVSPPIAILAAMLIGLVAGLLLSLPLARLRGVYQAIASLAFVQIIENLNLFLEDLTGGPLGLNGIPRYIETWHLLVAVALTMLFFHLLNKGGIARVFEAMRQDLAVATTLGVNPTNYHRLSFAISGAVGGLFGGLDALHNYSIFPEQFGFTFLVAALSYVVLGGRQSILGPLVGAIVLVLLPIALGPLVKTGGETKLAVYGLLLMLTMAFLPYGIVDTVKMRLKNRRLARLAAPTAEKAA
jgi:branched-chain amino acid transport system permease protein